MSGVSDRELDALEQAAETASSGRSGVTRLAEYAGERGEEQVLDREGYRIPDAFHSVRPPHTARVRCNHDPPVGDCAPSPAHGPGPGHVDGLAVSPRGDEVVIPEYKGGTAAYDPSKTYALDELDELGAPPAAQGTSDYVMDRMLEDERVPGTSTTTPACGSSSRTAVPACARTSSRPPAQGGPPGSAPRASRPHPASLPSSSRRSPVSKHSTTHQTPKRKDHPMTDFFVLQVREDVA